MAVLLGTICLAKQPGGVNGKILIVRPHPHCSPLPIRNREEAPLSVETDRVEPGYFSP